MGRLLESVHTGQSYAKANMLRGSPLKFSDVASLIRGMRVDKALTQLSFCKRRAANLVKKCLLSAIANAENNLGLDVDSLYVTEIMVGKALVMKRYRPRARGRSGKILKPFSNVKITVAEIQGN